jgi:hypothetical protein
MLIRVELYFIGREKPMVFETMFDGDEMPQPAHVALAVEITTIEGERISWDDERVEFMKVGPA